MKRRISLASLAFFLLALTALAAEPTPGAPPAKSAKSAKAAAPAVDGWITLFDGKTLDGWKASENPESWSVQDGAIVAHGKRSHLYYMGPEKNHNFKNFELKVDVETTSGSNGGIYIHTEFLENTWPFKGYEVQVDNSHTDWRRSGSLYKVVDVREQTAKDDVWFTEHIIVNGKNITIKVDGKTIVDYTEPDPPQPPEGMKGRVLSSGTIALQGHDPKSTVRYKNIQIKPLP